MHKLLFSESDFRFSPQNLEFYSNSPDKVIGNWLEKCQLRKYTTNFLKHGYFKLEDIATITEEKMKKMISEINEGERLRLLTEIQNLQTEFPVPARGDTNTLQTQRPPKPRPLLGTTFDIMLPTQATNQKGTYVREIDHVASPAAEKRPIFQSYNKKGSHSAPLDVNATLLEKISPAPQIQNSSGRDKEHRENRQGRLTDSEDDTEMSNKNLQRRPTYPFDQIDTQVQDPLISELIRIQNTSPSGFRYSRHSTDSDQSDTASSSTSSYSSTVSEEGYSSVTNYASKDSIGPYLANKISSAGSLDLPLMKSRISGSYTNHPAAHLNLSENSDYYADELNHYNTTERDRTTWKKGRLIGTGGFGNVYLALSQNGSLFAAKKLELRSTSDSSVVIFTLF